MQRRCDELLQIPASCMEVKAMEMALASSVKTTVGGFLKCFEKARKLHRMESAVSSMRRANAKTTD